jgi:hypothetical protein
MLFDKPPTISNGGKKKSMQDWLKSHNISYDEKMLRVELNQLVMMHKSQFPEYTIDRIATDNGHNIVRLPPYHCELNAIELIWAQVKGGAARNNTTFKINDVKQLLEQEINSVTPSNWANACAHVERLETDVFENELKIDATLSEEELSSFRFYPHDDDTDDSSSDSDSDTEVWPSDDSGDELLWIPGGSDYEFSAEHEPPEFPMWAVAEL